MATAYKAGMLGLFLLIAGLGGSSAAWGRADARGGERSIEIPLGGAQTVRVPSSPERVVVGDPAVCDVTPMGPGQLLLVAKAPGETQITVWSRDGSIVSYRVIASLPVSALQNALREALPAEDDILVRASAGVVYLTGKVSDAMSAEAASRIAQNLYASSGRKVAEVVNLLHVQAPQQVQVHMRFVEITRSNLRNMGFNHWMNNNSMSHGMSGPPDPLHYCLSCETQRFVGPENLKSRPSNLAMPNLPILTSPINGSFALSFASSTLLPMTATLALLEQHGVAKTLSEPTLVALSGHEAKFLVGGEVPIPMPDALGHILVQFKQYGAKIAFTPTVLSQDTVSLAVNAEVSALDKSNGVNLSNVAVPALQSRQSSTQVRLRDGQSFAIAGLLSDNIINSVAKVPLLGELPVLGALFRNTKASRTETELIVLVSINLVKPMEPGEMPPILHNEEFNDPGDISLFLLGWIDGTRRSETLTSKSRGVNRPAAGVPVQNSPEGAVGFSR